MNFTVDDYEEIKAKFPNMSWKFHNITCFMGAHRYATIDTDLRVEIVDKVWLRGQASHLSLTPENRAKYLADWKDLPPDWYSYRARLILSERSCGHPNAVSVDLVMPVWTYDDGFTFRTLDASIIWIRHYMSLLTKSVDRALTEAKGDM